MTPKCSDVEWRLTNGVGMIGWNGTVGDEMFDEVGVVFLSGG